METRRKFLQETATAGIAGIVVSGTAPAFAKERVAKGGVTLEQAWAVHRKCLIIDGHQDTSVRRFARKENPNDWMKRDTTYHSDIPRMKEGGQRYVGLFLIEDSTATDLWTITEFILEQLDAHPEDLMLVLSSEDAVRAGNTGKVGIIMEIEGPARWLNGNVNILRLLYRLGLRSVHITHGEGGSDPTFLQGTQSITGPCTPADREAQRKNAVGLTPFGMEVLKTENEMGIITDLSHSNDKAFFDVLEHTTRPPIMSHTAVFSLCNQYRCLTDDQIRALAAKGGVMGIVVLPGFIDADPRKATIDRVVDHILYVADLVGIDTVGFGSDYDGFSDPPIVPDVSQLVLLTQAMLSRGLTEEEIRKFWGGNFLRVFRQVIDKPEK
ncbi:membrane dipeptidase [bacterium]|nr:membrane dipeptidase [bacterium]